MADAKMLQNYADAGYHLTPLKGKVPFKPSWQKTPYIAHPAAIAFPENFGIVLQEDDCAVDCDPRNYKNGVNSFQKLQADLGWKIKGTPTPVVETGGGGLHVMGKKPADLEIVCKLDEYPGIEFLSKGHQIVAVSSIHPDTKKPYRLVQGVIGKDMRVPQLPKALLDLIRKSPVVKSTAEPVTTADDQTKLRFAEFCREAEPAVQGQGGDKQTYKVACYGRDLGLSDVDCGQIMEMHYNPRCVPPWDQEALATKVGNAYAYAEGIQGALHPAADFPVAENVPVRAQVELNWDRNPATNALIKSLNNCVNYFISPDSGLFNIIAWDQFTDQIMLVKPAPWHSAKTPMPKDGLPWTDSDTIQCMYYLSRAKHFHCNAELVYQAAINAAKRHPNHPVRNYLNSLIWDNHPRLDTWLSHYCGVPDSKYVRAVGAKTLLGAVARVFQPGVKFDYMLVLEGDQGTGKSTVVAILGGPYSGDIVIDPHDKDTFQGMIGKWILEASEMDFTTNTEVQAQKAFLSKQKDTFRAPYGRLSKDYHRQCIFIGTMNVQSGAGYLKDTTGNRRFWPVRTNKILLAALREDRDQLFAEAVYRYRIIGEALYLDDRRLEDMARAEQAERRMVDPWLEKISTWLDEDQFGTRKPSATTMEIWTDCLQGQEKNLDRRNSMRIAHVMRDELKWIHGLIWVPEIKRHLRGYSRPQEIQTAELNMESTHATTA